MLPRVHSSGFSERSTSLEWSSRAALVRLFYSRASYYRWHNAEHATRLGLPYFTRLVTKPRQPE